MKYKNPLLVVRDPEKSKAFYREVLGLRVILDFGANITLTGGVSLQTEETWARFIGCEPGDIRYDGRDAELYFEEDEFDAFAQKLARRGDIRYVHPPQEHPWGQRAVRFQDPDGHVIEVGENIKAVCRRFAAAGMTEQQVAARMDVPLKFVKAALKGAPA